MKSRELIALLALPLVATRGCQQAEQQAEGEQAQQMEAASEGEMAGGAMSSIELAALNNSGITGMAQLSHTADDLTVTLDMEGLTAGESYMAHIHKGTCEQGGPPVVTLQAIEAQDGTGTSTTMVAMSELMADDEMADDEMAEDDMAEEGMGEGEMMDGHEMMDGEMTGYYIQVHNPDGSPAACANIKAGDKMKRMES